MEIYQHYSYNYPEHLARESEYYQILREEVKSVLKEKGFEFFLK